MRKYKEIENEIIISIGEGARNGITISDSEYETILLMIQNKPTAPVGYDYHLRVNLTWELIELPPIPDESEE